MKITKEIEVNWLRLEDKIRKALEEYNKGTVGARGTLIDISDTLGDETGRGYEIVDD